MQEHHLAAEIRLKYLSSNLLFQVENLILLTAKDVKSSKCKRILREFLLLFLYTFWHVLVDCTSWKSFPSLHPQFMSSGAPRQHTIMVALSDTVVAQQ